MKYRESRVSFSNIFPPKRSTFKKINEKKFELRTLKDLKFSDFFNQIEFILMLCKEEFPLLSTELTICTCYHPPGLQFRPVNLFGSVLPRSYTQEIQSCNLFWAHQFDSVLPHVTKDESQ